MPVSLSELDLALEFSSHGSLFGDQFVYLNRNSG